MNSNDIRSQIQRAIEKEQSTGNVDKALAAHLGPIPMTCSRIAINMRDIEHQVDVQLGGMGIF